MKILDFFKKTNDSGLTFICKRHQIDSHLESLIHSDTLLTFQSLYGRRIILSLKRIEGKRIVFKVKSVIQGVDRKSILLEYELNGNRYYFQTIIESFKQEAGILICAYPDIITEDERRKEIRRMIPVEFKTPISGIASSLQEPEHESSGDLPPSHLPSLEKNRTFSDLMTVETPLTVEISFFGTIGDLSPHGVGAFVESVIDLKTGNPLFLKPQILRNNSQLNSLQFTLKGNPPLILSGKLVYSHYDRSSVGIGIEFCGITNEQKKVITNFLEEMSHALRSTGTDISDNW